MQTIVDQPSPRDLKIELQKAAHLYCNNPTQSLCWIGLLSIVDYFYTILLVVFIIKTLVELDINLALLS